MKFEIIRALPKDVEVLNHIMQTVTAGMERAEWFISDDLPYIRAHIGSCPLQKSDQGFILKAVVAEQEQIVGFFMVDFPGATERNLGVYLDLSAEEMERVAHMDSVAILPEYRGHGLQYLLMEAAEKIIAEETDYDILLATVHPENRYSLQNALKHGYEVVREVTKQDVYRRYVLKKGISWLNN